MAEYIDLDQARDVLEQMGIRLTRRQIKRASDRTPRGGANCRSLSTPSRGG